MVLEYRHNRSAAIPVEMGLPPGIATSPARTNHRPISLFATAFARRLIEPDVEINKLFRFVRQDVMAATNRRQEPFVYGSLPPEDFFFAKAR